MPNNKKWVGRNVKILGASQSCKLRTALKSEAIQTRTRTRKGFKRVRVGGHRLCSRDFQSLLQKRDAPKIFEFC